MALYKKVVEDLTNHIDSGAFLPGERLPSIQELCDRYEVSQITIRAALRELVTAGYLESRRRAGIFVRDRRPDGPLLGSKIIAILVTAVQNPFHAELIRGAEAEARAHGYRLIVASSNNEPDLETQQIRELSGQVAGIIITPVTGSGNYAAYVALLDRNVPFVFLDRYVEKLAVPVVSSDNEQGGYEATQHLLDTGIKHVFVVGSRGYTSTQERVNGYRRALREANIPFDPSWVQVSSSDTAESAYISMKQVLARTNKRHERFGVFTHNEEIARGVYVAVKEAGLRIPDDVAVVGFDDISAIFLDPPLTTVRQRLPEMGATAVRLLLDCMRPGATDRSRFVRLACDLIVRSSSDSSSLFSVGSHLEDRGAVRDGKPVSV